MKIFQFVFLSLFAGFSAFAQVPQKEREALEDLYRFTNGEHWNNNWDFTQDINTWYGVEVSENHITGLVLNNNNLEGELPSTLDELVYLEHLNLSTNKLSGELPELNNLTALRDLGLVENELSGALLKAIDELDNLDNLELTKNFFSDYDRLKKMMEIERSWLVLV